MGSWDAVVYDRFAAERERPSHDLIARLKGPPPARILDLGCGSGLSTQALAQAFPMSEIVGLDLSPDMLAAASARGLPQARFLQGDLATFDASGFDLVFANAVMQWVPGHISVLRRLAEGLPQGGRLAVQMPDNLDEPSHLAMREVAARLGTPAPTRERIGALRDYEDALIPPCEDLDLWRTTYAHRLGGPGDIVKWVEGTGLRPFLEGLDEARSAAFRTAYAQAVAAAYPPSASGATLFPFPRLFLVATRGLG